MKQVFMSRTNSVFFFEPFFNIYLFYIPLLHCYCVGRIVILQMVILPILKMTCKILQCLSYSECIMYDRTQISGFEVCCKSFLFIL